MREPTILRTIGIPDRWGLHAYYTVSPYAPDGSGYVLMAAADLATMKGAVYLLDERGKIADVFGEHSVESSFFHTGFWQTWSPDSRFVYYQSGSLREPSITKREVATGKELLLFGDMEGAPPDGEPLLSGMLGMLYAAGYGTGVYDPQIAPIPFEARTQHGIFSYDFETEKNRLVLSTQDLLDILPEKEKLLELDRLLAKKNGTPIGLTLMTYCVRFCRTNGRVLLHFGNHRTCEERGEPKISYLFTGKRDLSDLVMAHDISSGGAHWSWHPNGKQLIGFARNEGAVDEVLCIMDYNGEHFRRLCSACGKGHPSICPTNHNLAVTDNCQGEVQFWNIEENRIIAQKRFQNLAPGITTRGTKRDRTGVCNHPVFDQEGKRLILNAFNGELPQLVELAVPE